jgi:hypothetical protein
LLENYFKFYTELQKAVYFHSARKWFFFYCSYREAERERAEQYEKELQEMKERLEERPLLFEQETQVIWSKYW